MCAVDGFVLLIVGSIGFADVRPVENRVLAVPFNGDLQVIGSIRDVVSPHLFGMAVVGHHLCHTCCHTSSSACTAVVFGAEHVVGSALVVEDVVKHRFHYDGFRVLSLAFSRHGTGAERLSAFQKLVVGFKDLYHGIGHHCCVKTVVEGIGYDGRQVVVDGKNDKSRRSVRTGVEGEGEGGAVGWHAEDAVGSRNFGDFSWVGKETL